MSIILEFPKCVKKVSVQETKELTYKEAQDMLMAEWNERNQIVSDDFHKYNAYEKQGILDTVLEMNNELYKMLIEAKGKLE